MVSALGQVQTVAAKAFQGLWDLRETAEPEARDHQSAEQGQVRVNRALPFGEGGRSCPQCPPEFAGAVSGDGTCSEPGDTLVVPVHKMEK